MPSALRQLQVEYNALLSIARVQRAALTWSRRRALDRFRPWTQVPASVPEGAARLERLRGILGPEAGVWIGNLLTPR